MASEVAAQRVGSGALGGPAGPSKWTARQVGRFKPVVFILALYPVAHWVWLGFGDGLTANPPEFLIRSSGVWALALLCMTLGVTPLRRLIRQPALVRFRRMLGLFSFFYTALHVWAWAYWERGWSLSSMGEDVLQRPFIAIGLVATVGLLALACTSTRGWMRRMGHWWVVLHRVVYVAAVLSVWHFWLIRAGKNNFLEPYVYGAVVGVLLVVRAGIYWRERRVGGGMVS
ncbi:MAG: sulfoxide reductase heme-binding subunit YedZ [Burkholderiaceae bacterium]|nr:MAG: sulfoxide reductase heme-binding subunit YedZ [Burkholderiaceae bacterium]TAM06677.1 MAG: sulfoxide reductase heme-binding subunit YedZ [Pusillimonas sp.]